MGMMRDDLLLMTGTPASTCSKEQLELLLKVAKAMAEGKKVELEDE